jgi:hypothetical protein
MHLKPQDIKHFDSNTLETKEMIAFLEHLDSCDFCLEQITSDKILAPDIQAPACLKEQILARAAQADVQTAKAVKETSHKMQLFYCSLRTAAGVVAALFLLFTMGSIDFSSLLSKEPVQIETMVSEPPQKSRPNYLNKFSSHLGRKLNKSTFAVSSGLNQITNFINGGN